MTAVISIVGRRNLKLNFTARLPFKYMEYINAHIREIPRQTGCMNTIEKANTNVKYEKFTNGW
jgi:ubiquinone/menaquinone biosynthesis C-methylase UbiE